MKTKKILVRSVLVLVALAALCACAWCVWYIIQYYQGQSFGDRMRTNAPDDTGSFQLERVKIPVDFDELQAMNPDIYAWVTIPDTDISYAVLQRAGEEEYYSKHSENGAYYSGGSIFSQDYNQKDFSDPMTVLYGHNLRNGRMFAQLNDFSDAEGSLRRTATSISSISRTGCSFMRSQWVIRIRTSTCCCAMIFRM